VPNSASSSTAGQRIAPWAARLGWLLVAVLGGAAVGSALDGRSRPVVWVGAIGAWALWAVVATALLIAAVRSLTIVRIGTPLAGGAALATAVGGAPAGEVGLLAVTALVTCGAAFSAEFGRACVQVAAYGDEERFPLRPPAAAGAAAVVAWLVWAAALLIGPLALAARGFVVGVALTAMAIGLLVALFPRWNRFARRWLVLVPAGLVVHDPVVLADTVMLRTRQIRSVRLAPADTAAADLTGPASGYALEVASTESIDAVLAFTPREPNGTVLHLTAFLVAPTRPGAALRAAARRGLPVAGPT
jgi:hypothetical protein